MIGMETTEQSYYYCPMHRANIPEPVPCSDTEYHLNIDDYLQGEQIPSEGISQ